MKERNGIKRIIEILIPGPLCFFGLTLFLTGWVDAAAERPLFRDDFNEVAAQGFGDRHNTKAWSMIWWQEKLYVGTARAHKCATDASAALRLGDPFHYPSKKDPDVECTESPQDLPLRAEIWRLTPAKRGMEEWEWVFQSPEDVEIPGYPGKYVARDAGLRDMVIFKDQLFVDGVSSLTFNPGVPPPRLLHSENGLDFEAVPQDPGTVLGDLGFKQAGMRSMATYKDRLFISIGELRGMGLLYESANPEGGNDNFRLVGPSDMSVYEMCVYNGYLYLGLTQSSRGDGYSVVKTDASGEPPYTFTPVVTNGGFLTPRPSDTVVSMYVFKGRLYVGTDKPAEIIRIKPDDSWDLVVGTPRVTPDGPKYPLSGMRAGFNWPLNEHIWRMVEHEGWLYIGTNDATTLIKNWPITNWPIFGAIVKQNIGFDLAVTPGGWYYTIIDRRGFGDLYGIGIRTFASTPHGLFFGTSNPYYGLRIWQGTYKGSIDNSTIEDLNPASRLETEINKKSVLLSWDYPGEMSEVNLFHVFRTSNSSSFENIGTTDQLFFEDTDILEGQSYMYYITVEAVDGRVSQPSNCAPIPSFAPVITFNGIFKSITRLGLRNKFKTPNAKKQLFEKLDNALDDLTLYELQGTERKLKFLHQMVKRNKVKSGDKIMDQLCAEDMEILLSKLIKRVRLVRAGLLSPSDLY